MSNGESWCVCMQDPVQFPVPNRPWRPLDDHRIYEATNAITP